MASTQPDPEDLAARALWRPGRVRHVASMVDPIATLNAALEGRYVLERPVDEGGMATVYRARDLRHDRVVAVKVLRPELSVSPERFLQEIRLTARLQHPGIVPLFDSGEAAGHPFYVMPLLEGGSLRTLLDQEGPLPLDRALTITRELASALAYAHSEGIIHRDIKPANILFSQGRPLLADFGIARAVTAASRDRVTATGFSLGTPTYMSPEQVLGERDLDARSDIYSLGCVLYEMVEGEPPFGGPTRQALFRRLAEMPPAMTRGPEAVSRIAMRALATQPEDRYPSATDLEEALAGQGPKPGSGSARVRGSAGRVRGISPRFRFPGTHPVLRAASLVLVALIVAGLWYVVPAAIGLVEPPSLIAQGLLQEGDVLVLADFESTPDTTLGDMVTEALRVDLATSASFGIMESNQIRQVLGRMARDLSSRLTPDLSREIAIREGAKAVISGEVGAVGTGYLLVARILAAADGATLASFRVSAEDGGELIAAIDQLSADLRGNVGESLRAVRAGQPLEEVTTPSLEALRSYAAGTRAFRAGNAPAAVGFFREAIALDSSFAMAFQFLGPALQSGGGSSLEQREVLTRAFQLRERLTPKERYATEASYHDQVSMDVDAELFAYERILELEPNREGTLSNYGRALAQHFGRFEEAEEQLDRAIAQGSFPSLSNMVWVQIFQNDLEGARLAQEQFERDFADSFWKHRGRFFVEYFGGNAAAAHAAADSLSRHPAAPERWHSRAVFYVALADLLAGREAEARAHLEDEVERVLRNGRPDLALTRTMDRVWMEGVVIGDLETAQALARNALESGWLEAEGAETRPFFPSARDAARAGAIREARGFLDRWAAMIGSGRPNGYAEDRAVAEALLAASEGSRSEALSTLLEIQGRTGPRFPQGEWPSMHHCQRCYRFDIARLYLELGQVDPAIEAFEAVLREVDDIVETPINRILAAERLGRLYEERGDTGLATTAYRRIAEAWAAGERELGRRGREAAARALALESPSEEVDRAPALSTERPAA